MPPRFKEMSSTWLAQSPFARPEGQVPNERAYSVPYSIDVSTGLSGAEVIEV